MGANLKNNIDEIIKTLNRTRNGLRTLKNAAKNNLFDFFF